MENKETKNEIIAKETTNYAVANLGDTLTEELAGLQITLDRIKVPAGGSLAYEVPSSNPDEPEMAKEFRAVILTHHPIQSYYKEKYTGANEAPDCHSYDCITGVDRETGEIKDCKSCQLNKFGSGSNEGKACKAKRRVFLLLENSALPVIFTIPTTSLGDFSKYIMRLIGKGKKSYQVVTKFSLKKDTNKGGITYSKVVLGFERDLTETENANVVKMVEQVRGLAESMKSNNADENVEE
jgi:hypothetical protein